MSNPLDKVATDAVTASHGFETGKSMCERFARQCVEACFGVRYDAIMHKPTAKEAGEAFAADGRFVHDPKEGSIPGDLLYKIHGSGGFGHVGIRVTGNRVAENSVVHYNATDGRDGRGFRSLDDFGPYDLIVRLK